ncbi:MAG: 4'-phosphopantetheinyl transferase family protein [Janthinobacterium lividum]
MDLAVNRGNRPFIDLWQTSVSSLTSSYFAAALALLSPEQRQYILSYRDPSDQMLHVIGRLLVRQYVQHTGQLFDWDEWQYSPAGKPFLTTGPCFNISQADSQVIAAFSSHPVGIDVEKMQGLDIQPLLAYLHPAEQYFIASSADQTTAFFTIWTRKEALLKGMGIGITEDLATHNCVEHFIQDDIDWYLHSFTNDAAYSVALATPLPDTNWKLASISASLLIS